MSTKTSTINHWQFISVWLLWFTVLSLLLAYLVLVGVTILYLVEREETERRITELESNATVLVADYLDKTSSIDLDLAYHLGFQDISSPRVFATRAVDDVVTLSWLDNEN